MNEGVKLIIPFLFVIIIILLIFFKIAFLFAKTTMTCIMCYSCNIHHSSSLFYTYPELHKKIVPTSCMYCSVLQIAYNLPSNQPQQAICVLQKQLN